MESTSKQSLPTLVTRLKNKDVLFITQTVKLDVNIARAAVSSSECIHTIIIREDTDMLILLLDHAKDNEFKVYYRGDVRYGSTPSPVYDILNRQSLLVVKAVTLLRALMGCDTTSRIISIGKFSAFVKLLKETHFRSVTKIFCSDSCLHSDFTVAGRKAKVLWY